MKYSDLEGKRIILIKINESGLGDMWEYSRQPIFYQHMEYEPHRSIEDTRKYLHKLFERQNAGAHYWFIVNKDKNRIIGSVGINEVDLRKGHCQIGYGLSPDYWGQGYMGEALQLVLRYLFVDLNFHRVSTITASKNTASVKLLERAGFTREGILRDFYYSYDGHRFNAVLFGILKDEYMKNIDRC